MSGTIRSLRIKLTYCLNEQLLALAASLPLADLLFSESFERLIDDR